MAIRASRTAAAGIGAIVVMVVLGLTGCTGSGFTVLDRDAAPGDVLPASLPDHASDDLEPSSIRFAGVYDGDRLYVAKGAGRASRGDGSVCLLVYPTEGEGWGYVCGHSGVSMDNGVRKYELHIDNPRVPDGAVRVSPNIFVIDRVANG
jgi:hypothetical protein